MNPEELRNRALAEISELGTAPPSTSRCRLWHEERRGAAVLLAGLADWDGSLLRRAATGPVGKPNGRVRSLLFDAADIADDEQLEI